MRGYIYWKKTHEIHLLSIHFPNMMPRGEFVLSRGEFILLGCFLLNMWIGYGKMLQTSMVLQVSATASHCDHRRSSLADFLIQMGTGLLITSSWSITKLTTARNDWAPKLDGLKQLQGKVNRPCPCLICFGGPSVPIFRNPATGFLDTHLWPFHLWTTWEVWTLQGEISPTMPTNIQSFGFPIHKARECQLKIPKHITAWWLTYASETYESQWELIFPIYGKIKNVPNHQPN